MPGIDKSRVQAYYLKIAKLELDGDKAQYYCFLGGMRKTDFCNTSFFKYVQVELLFKNFDF